MYHKGKAAKYGREVFISHQLRIFNPANCKQKLTGEMIKHHSKTSQSCQMQFQAHAKAFSFYLQFVRRFILFICNLFSYF